MFSNAAPIALLVTAIAAQAPVPPLLDQAILRLPGVRLLDPSVDLPGGYTVAELKDFGFWPPWITTDVDRDGRPDVVAVVVKRGASPQFGVLAVHRRAAAIHWVASFGDKPINGVAKGPGRDTVVPLFCIECDANSWYRWSGRAYEPELYAVGERLVIATYEHGKTVGLFARATGGSKLLFTVEPCTTQAVVRRVAGSEAERWYFVETQGRDRVRGWIPASFASGDACIG